MASSPPDWSDSNLRRRSFRGQNLIGVNFQGADLRGCDFSNADLTGANLAQARIGGAPELWFWGIFLMIGTGLFAFQYLSQLIFGILGLTSTDPNFGLRLALLSILATVGLLMSLMALGLLRSVLRYWVGGLEGALVGFYVGGWVTDLSLNSAVTGSILGSLLFCCAVRFAWGIGAGVIVATFGVAMSNGLFFLAGVSALQRLSVGHLLHAVAWLMVMLLYWLITLQAIRSLYGEIQQMGVTSFAGANLSQVQW